ncbi:TetR/AcrR family transcriptional regulator [Flavobacterium caeni]|uniref:Transcriptional regulator, TetR family n=1 Tax=Flavobacterium caeni TaxID=490189 RepID=A0A1G5EJ14_9FLAO|nr:TetR/AcrR family transcriptional regulator [Flavobacterium caeni]SCY26771.1 transcriptional regulator, TetR family [Flavobacterium caeni]
MEEKIIAKATDMFLRLGFKSVTMDDIAGEMGISKKTIYKYFINKEVLIEESTEAMHKQVHVKIEAIMAQNHNPIRENFELRRMFKNMFQAAETSPLYQLKKHYPELHQKTMCHELEDCYLFLRQNIDRGIYLGLYRKDMDIEKAIKFYYMLIFQINENTVSEKEAQELELAVLEYHTRAIATEKGIKELEFNLSNNN